MSLWTFLFVTPRKIKPHRTENIIFGENKSSKYPNLVFSSYCCNVLFPLIHLFLSLIHHHCFPSRHRSVSPPASLHVTPFLISRQANGSPEGPDLCWSTSAALPLHYRYFIFSSFSHHPVNYSDCTKITNPVPSTWEKTRFGTHYTDLWTNK